MEVTIIYNHQLETFLSVADAGSFNKAAEKSYITPTAVIKQINLLEEDLGVKLFERSHRGLTLTKAGQSLYNDSKYVIQYCKDSVIRAKNAMLEDGKLIRVGTSPMTPAQALVDLWPKLQTEHPKFKLKFVPYENTPENAREILAHLGQNIDIVPGLFDDTLLDIRGCSGYELSREPICCAVSVNHPLAVKSELEVSDLYGESLMLMHRGWSSYVDALRDDLEANHQKINIVNFDFYNLEIFNRCEYEGGILMAVRNWAGVHPLLKVLPVKWEHSIPYGFLYAKDPSENVWDFLEAVRKTTGK